MKKKVLALLCLLGLAFTVPAMAAPERNAFDPYMQTRLPNLRKIQEDELRLMQKLGVRVQSLQAEAAHRPHWRSEVYPVFFGKPGVREEIIVVLDFAEPRSLDVWKSVIRASRHLSPDRHKIVVYGMSSENYGMDLMGLGIWQTYSRPAQTMNYMLYALEMWHYVKRVQGDNGNVRPFRDMYDATTGPADLPIHYKWFANLQPPIPDSEELALSRYSYDAGNVNMYQARQVYEYYGLEGLPAVIVNGRVLGTVTHDTILDAISK